MFASHERFVYVNQALNSCSLPVLNTLGNMGIVLKLPVFNPELFKAPRVLL